MEREQDILAIKRLINQVIPYKKEIIFFGSRVNGNFRSDSDFDILVNVERQAVARKELIRFQAKIKRLCAKIGLDADLVVRDESHTREMRNFPGNIIHAAYQTGVRI